ncbi:MAG: hypothetical protein WBC85_10520 [Planktotalea sp.]
MSQSFFVTRPEQRQLSYVDEHRLLCHGRDVVACVAGIRVDPTEDGLV